MKKILSVVVFVTIIGAGWGSMSVEGTDNYLMAVLGDSVSTGFNSENKWNNLENSWASGTAIDRHFVRLHKKFPNKQIEVLNLAIPGVDSSDIERQAKAASIVTLDYVTIFIGSNDLCRGFHNVGVYEQRIRSVIKIITDRSPKVKILISSIPNIVDARHAAKGLSCDKIWSKVMNTCDVSDEDKFYDVWWSMNTILDVISRSNDNVIFSDAVMTREIKKESISKIDCFHPNLKAQKEIAEMTWNDSWFK